MSRSNPKLQNPAKKFIEWSGSKGEFYYYDKEKGENVFLSMPIYFMVLDELNTVTGYSEDAKAGIFSNEVRNISIEKLNVRVFGKGTIEIGVWKDIKAQVKTHGGKFAKSVYALMLTKDGTELVNFKFTGSSFGGAELGGGWLNAKWNKETGGIQVRDIIEGKKGATKFFAPKFEKVNVKEEHNQLALQADIELQKYLDSYLKSLPDVEKTDTEIAVENTYEEFQDYGNFPDADSSPEETNDIPF